MVKTIIHFRFGGCYVMTGVGYEWKSKEGRGYALTFRTSSTEEITYSVVEDLIFKKMGIDRITTQLKMSYIPRVVGEKFVSYIVDDDDLDSYISGGDHERRCPMYVEVLKRDGEKHDDPSEMESNGRAMNALTIYGDIGEKHDDPSEIGGVGEDDNIGILGEDDDEYDDEYEGEDEDEDGDDHEYLDEDENVDEHEYFDEEEHENVDVDDHENNNGFDEVGNGMNDIVEIPCGENEKGIVEEWDDQTGLELGQEFESKDEVQDIISRASHKNCYEFKILNSDTRRYVVRCVGVGCKWYIRVSKPKLAKEGKWKVVTYRNMHSCSRLSSSTTSNGRKGTAKLVASVLKTLYPGVKDTPPVKSIIGVVQTKASVLVSHDTAWRGKRLAADYVRGDVGESYKMLPSYLFMLEKMNSGTVTRFVLDEDKSFRYLFVALGACIEGFKALRKVLSVDATFLKTRLGGVLVFAIAQDPNLHHYPIAFAVLDGENEASWNWFFSQLKEVVDDDPELVFLSDRNPSLIKAIAELYPRAGHGFCTFHLSQNLRTRAANVNKDIVAETFRAIAKIYTEADFLKAYDEFGRRYPKVVEYLESSVVEGPRKWARCYFPGERYNITTTNSSESINNVFRHARTYSILHMIDAIVEKVAEWFNKYRKESAGISSERMLVPFVENKLHGRCKSARKLKVRELNTFHLEYNVIGRDGKPYLVDLRQKSCTCRCFDIDKFPCVHAIAALLSYTKRVEEERPLDIDVNALCSKYYRIEMWSLAYYRTIYSVPHKSQWTGIPEHIQASWALPPKCRKRKGRNQETRFPSVGEKRRRTSNKYVRGQNLGRWFGTSDTDGTSTDAGGSASATDN